jgi:16S rRNA (cytosine1402-N4)-methyltransferase
MNNRGLKRHHVPVLADKIIELLDIQENDIVVDGTLGLGGHAKRFMAELGSGGRLIGFDLDNRNMQEARKRLKRFEGRINYVNDSYERIEHYMKVLKLTEYDKVLLDLGTSSPHLDIAEYGFSFKKQGPLDMRFSQDNKVTAALVVNKLPEDKLVEIFSNFGELPGSKKLAAQIVEERKKRPFVYTLDFVERISPAIPNKELSKRLPLVFQALRIAVNDELNVLKRALRKLFDNMSKGGRMAVISYHSLEDRIVKQFIQDLLKPPVTSMEESMRRLHGDPLCEVLTKKVVTPLKEEVDENPRSRSAKLRVIKKL